MLVGAATVVNVRETLVPVAVVAVLKVTVVPETAVTVVPDAMPVPETELPTTIVEEADVTAVTDVLPDVVLPVVVTVADTELPSTIEEVEVRYVRTSLFLATLAVLDVTVPAVV